MAETGIALGIDVGAAASRGRPSTSTGVTSPPTGSGSRHPRGFPEAVCEVIADIVELRRGPRPCPHRRDDPRGRHPGRRALRREHRLRLDRLRRRGPPARRARPPRGGRQRRRRRRHRRDVLRRRTRARGTGGPDDPRHRHRYGPHPRRRAHSQLRARHLEVDGHDAETRASSGVREAEGLGWDEAARLQRYYSHLEALLWPDLFVVGGGVSKKADRFLPLLDLRTPLVPAQLENRAGIIGAAHLAARSA